MTDATAPSGTTLQVAPYDDAGPAYIVDPLLQELRQSEILTGLVQYEFDPSVPPSGQAKSFKHDFVIVASQDCDLQRGFEKGEEGYFETLNGVLLFEAIPVDGAAKDKSKLNSAEWRKVRGNQNERYHVLSNVPAELDSVGDGLPELLVDFRRFFAMSPKEIYRQCEMSGGAKRRCRLRSPYREHFQCRAAFYIQRVALPEP